MSRGVTVSDGTERDNFMGWLPLQLAETLPTVAVDLVNQIDGSTTMVLYLFGEGYELLQNGS